MEPGLHTLESLLFPLVLIRPAVSLVQVKDRDAISRSFRFKDFKEAFSFMSRVALAAEQVMTRFGYALSTGFPHVFVVEKPPS
jgi:hypothetical protein